MAPVPPAPSVTRELRAGLCVEEQRCKVRDAKSGCHCAMIADHIDALRTWAEDEQRGRHRAEEQRTEARGEIERLRSAVDYLLRRIKGDPRVAYYFGRTESLSLLTRAYAESVGADPSTFHREFDATLSTERPRCPSGECQLARAT